MKKLFLLWLFIPLINCALAQKSDSIAYQQERIKINAMLAQRTQKFGQYDQSLKMHSGIFGFQTKNDIRRSNDILMDIVKTDDDIYKELKILLDFRAFEQAQVQVHAQQATDNTIGYITTINKLRDHVAQLNKEAIKQQQATEKTKRGFIIVLIIMLLLIIILLSKKRKNEFVP